MIGSWLAKESLTEGSIRMTRQRGRFVRGGRRLVNEVTVLEMARDLAASIGKSSNLTPITRGELPMIRRAARARWDVAIDERRRIIRQLVTAIRDEDSNLASSATATLLVLHTFGWLTASIGGGAM